ncbi:MAG TPA: methyltransferase domain-containing protein, partial [Burkholderiales bacterium]|nr:methyltransferase domain-containing protein [Burkholderiales bacterium]
LKPDALDVDDYVRRQFPAAPFRPLEKRGADVLIAGCGTGQQSIETAQQWRGARVLAVDLSLASLAYAQRKTAEAGIAGIEYAQADILNLPSLGREFDVIESVGVLHHLADPMAGWRALMKLLRPGGLMRLGFYSELARRDVVAAREFIAKKGFTPDAAGIRQCRQALVASGDPVFDALFTKTDFYATSSCRDLVMHVQEHRYNLRQIREALDALGLVFLGFTLQDSVLRSYSERFPEDPTRTDLDKWQQFEAENPDTFISMYQFWTQKAP